MIIESNKLIKTPVVSVMILAFNHDKFIEKAINSVLTQDFDYEFEIVIGEDFSSDKTREICIKFQNRYPEKIKLLLQDSNKGLFQNYHDVLNLCRGKYITGCSGDDYWIDNLKIKKQFDFLENNSNYVLIHTGFYILKDQNKDLIENRINNNNCDTLFEDLLNGNQIGALTIFYRNIVYFEYIEDIRPLEKLWLMEDYPFWLWISLKYKIKYIPDLTAVYRIHSNSISNSNNLLKEILFEFNVAQIREFFANKVNMIELIKEDIRLIYFETFEYFYTQLYFGKEVKLLKQKLKLYNKLSYLDKIRLWGLNNKYTYFCSKLYIECHKRFRKLFISFFKFKTNVEY